MMTTVVRRERERERGKKKLHKILCNFAPPPTQNCGAKKAQHANSTPISSRDDSFSSVDLYPHGILKQPTSFFFRFVGILLEKTPNPKRMLGR
jgi:hypothetical protein